MTSTTHLKRLSALAVLAVAAALVAFSGAWFASTDESEGSSVTTADVALQLFTSTERETPAPDDTAAGTAVLDATHLRPGAPARERTVELRNGGDVDIDLAITKVGDGGPETAALLQALTLSVEDCGADATCASPASVYAGSLKDAATVSLPGSLAPGASRFIRLRLTWPLANDDPALYDLATEIALRWSGTTT